MAVTRLRRMTVTITPEMCIGGRELHRAEARPEREPGLPSSPAMRAAAADPAGVRSTAGPSGSLTTLPAPAPRAWPRRWLLRLAARRCRHRRTPSATARCGASRCPAAGRPADDRRPRAPRTAPAVCARRLVRRLRRRPGRGVDPAARRERRPTPRRRPARLLLRPGRRPVGHARGVPGVERARHAVGRLVDRDGVARRRCDHAVAPRGRGGAQQPRFAPDGTPVARPRRVGLAQRVVGRASARRRAVSSTPDRRGVRASGPTPSRPTGAGSRSRATRPGSGGSASSTWRPARSRRSRVACTANCRGAAIGWPRCAPAARTPTQVVVYDTAAWARTHARRRPGGRMGRRRAARSPRP